MRFNMTSPCINCPFRSDSNRCILEPFRAKQISESLLKGEMFSCHETINYGRRNRKTEKHCAGAIITLEHMDKPNNYMQIFGRLGYYIKETMNFDAPVFKTMKEFLKVNEEN